jgi:hypothetical protein
MIPNVFRACWSCYAVAALIGAPRVASAQAPVTPNSRTAEIVNALLRYRVFWLRDTTSVDACRVHSELGKPSDFATMLAPRFRTLFRYSEDICAARDRPEHLVSLESIKADESRGTVELLVVHGEYVHHETYSLFASPWAVGAVTLDRASQVKRPPQQ